MACIREKRNISKEVPVLFSFMVMILAIQRWTKRWTCFAKQQPGSNRQKFSQPLSPSLYMNCRRITDAFYKAVSHEIGLPRLSPKRGTRQHPTRAQAMIFSHKHVARRAWLNEAISLWRLAARVAKFTSCHSHSLTAFVLSRTTFSPVIDFGVVQ